MNVIGGRFRGRKLKAPPGLDTRPVQARTREALFAMLGDLDGLRFLDCFAGTGAMGIEALSRGAAEAVFVEQAARPARIIRENLAALGLPDTVIQQDVFTFLDRHRAGGGKKFDIAFADPPYDMGLSQRTVAEIGRGVFFQPPGGLLIVTTRKTEELPTESGVLTVIRERRYGDTLVTVYRAGEGE